MGVLLPKAVLTGCRSSLSPPFPAVYLFFLAFFILKEVAQVWVCVGRETCVHIAVQKCTRAVERIQEKP